MLIIGTSSKKRGGKNTAADEILRRLPGGKQIAFADALKDEVCKALGISRDELERNKAIFRQILQWWGTAYRREYCGNKNYWIEQVDNVIQHYRGTNIRYFVITDVRFHNEYEYVKNLGGFILRIESSRCDMEDQHQSEVELDQARFDLRLRNDSTLIKFRRSVRTIAERVIAQRL